jgi:hypothetical protein
VPHAQMCAAVSLWLPQVVGLCHTRMRKKRGCAFASSGNVGVDLSPLAIFT